MDKKRLVRDVYHRGVILCKPDTPLQEVVGVLANTGIHAVMVAEREGEPPEGIISHTEVIAHYGEDMAALHAGDVATTGVISVSEGVTVEAAVKKILESNIHRLLVMGEDGRPLGILSTTDIVREMRNTRRMWYLD
ncbi:MAG: CBS domain-containing protein [Chloroflexi bacterium]|nr:CBS domain-containing protein [Chloroflexota bacterium]